MSVLCLVVSSVAEAMINSGRFSVIFVRRLMNSIGQYVPALGLIIVAFAGCDTALVVTALALGLGCNAATFSGFQVDPSIPEFCDWLCNIQICPVCEYRALFPQR